MRNERVANWLKGLICLLFFIAFIFVLCSCGFGKTTDKKDYDLFFGNVLPTTLNTKNGFNTGSLLRFDEYSYCSYLALFPRTMPDDISEFYYSYNRAINFDPYIIYFVYHLDKTEFERFESNLLDFKIEYNGQVNHPIYDTEHFKYPTYILTWMNAGNPMETYGIAEYVMLDKANGNVVNVFKMCNSFQDVQIISDYDIMPSAFEVADIIPEEKQNYNNFHILH